MNTEWNSHAKLGRIAVNSLTAEEKEFLAFPPEGEDLKHFPPCADGADQLAASCLLMDLVYDPLYRAYGLQANGMQLTHALPDEDGRGICFSGKLPSPGKFAEILTYLMENALNALNAGNKMEFLRRAGILGHFLQDATAPTHTITSELLRTLFPDPEPGRLTGFGAYAYQIGDGAAAPVGKAAASIPEAVFLLTCQAWDSCRRARALLPELMKRIYRQDKAGCRELLLGPVQDAAAMTAFAWHTVFSLFFGKKTEELKTLPLTELVPMYRHPDLYQFAPSGVFCKSGHFVPLAVIGKDGTETFSDGFGMSGYSGMKFFLNGIFREVEFQLGLEDAPESRDPHIDIEFSVETAPGWNGTFSEDMEYGAKPVLQTHIGPGEPVRSFKAAIPGTGTLIFAARARSYRSESGRIDFAIPHIAVLNPKLS